MAALNRKELSKKVLYPENAAFVLTRKGALYPRDEVRARVEERAKRHTPLFRSRLIVGLMSVGFFALFLLIFPLLSRGLAIDPDDPTFNLMMVFGIALLVVGLVIPLIIARRARWIDHHPKIHYFNRLRAGTITIGRVKTTSSLPNDLTELTYAFKVRVDVQKGRFVTQETRHGLGHINIPTSKGSQPNDELVILYSDEKLHIVL